jgi:hypothetical protein
VPAVRDLNRSRGAVAGALGISADPVRADHPCARVRLEPAGQGPASRPGLRAW